ncbi:hypothetical protein GCM10027047_39030 [Rhodococcus aerolatus]
MTEMNPLFAPAAPPPPPPERVESSAVLGEDVAATFGPTEPLHTVSAPGGDGVPWARVTVDPLLWVVGVHGGSGSGTVTALLSGLAPAGDNRPVLKLREQLPQAPAGYPAPRVLLVTRTHITGLSATARLAQHWATGRTGIHLIGVAALDDAPKLPPVLVGEVRRLAGMVPALWHLPWVEAWRTDLDLDLDRLPRRTRRSVTAIHSAAAKAAPSPDDRTTRVAQTPIPDRHPVS